MGTIQIAILPIEDIVDEACNFIKEVYAKQSSSIRDVLTDFFKDFNENLSVFIEYPYVDRVYRDSYYTYFASKHTSYDRDCIRVCFFNNEIQPEYFRDIAHHKYLREAFLGYLVIRPTFPNVIGRSLLSKFVFRNTDFVTCRYEGNVMVNGVKLTIKGFPHSSQDVESISCAETTIWGVMEYFGNRYADYKPALPSHIIHALNHYTRQRLLPSSGLTVDQISYALKEFGFGTYVYSRDGAYGEELENIISTYIESGIPLIAAITNEHIGHALVIIGHENDINIDFESQETRSIILSGSTVAYIDYTDVKKRFVVQDDNLSPCKLVYLDNPAEHYSDVDDSFNGAQIESIVVPLYKKIYLEAYRAKNIALKVLQDRYFGFAFQEGFVFRFFLSSNRSLKAHIATETGLQKKLQDDLVLIKMPKFVWCAEVFDREGYEGGIVTGLIILDATEARINKEDALIFAGYPDKYLFKSGREFVSSPTSFGTYTRFKTNLT